ncbi:MAG: putative sulfate exporter family transporter [Phycisphaerales bacterium]|nr:putative sulfate exporter family transporter [Phycisphaerales bacterium]
MIAGLLACLTPWVSPAIALAAGMVLAIAIGNPFRKRTGRIAKYLLQASVVLLGFGMNLPIILRVGMEGAIFAAITIAITFFLGFVIARLLRIDGTAATLISAGTAICGGSAIAAVGSAIDADDGRMTVSIGTVFLLNAVALYLFPILGHLIGLNQNQFGVWSGIAIHDVSSVVGAASTYGDNALQIATAVKLSRTLWIIPVTFAVAWFFARRPQAASVDSISPSRQTKITIPWFIGLFLLASLLRSFVPGLTSAEPTILHIAKLGMTVTLFLIGAGLSLQTLRSVGPRALVLGVALWVFIGGTSLGVILLSG